MEDAPIRLKPVTRGDVKPLVAMDACEGGDLVAPNAVSLAQAAYESGAHPMVIWRGQDRVCFLSVIHPRGPARLGEDDDREAAYLWRMMVDAPQQGQGIGRAAMRELMGWLRARGTARPAVSAAPENARAIGLYESMGMSLTGRADGDEIGLAGPVPHAPPSADG